MTWRRKGPGAGRSKTKRFHPDKPTTSKEDSESSDSEGEQEPRREYTKGGYHLVKFGDLLNEHYHVIRKVGWGEYSTVWLCWDFKCDRFVAIKVVKSGLCFTSAAKDEINMLKNMDHTVSKNPYRDKVVKLIEDFKISGENGTHICMVFEFQGSHLLKWIVKSNHKGLPIPCVKTIIKQVLQGLTFIHTACGIIHTDIKPENILLCVDNDYCWKLTTQAIKWQETEEASPPKSAVSSVLYYKKGVKRTRNRSKSLTTEEQKKTERIQALKEMLKMRTKEERATCSFLASSLLFHTWKKREEGTSASADSLLNPLDPHNAMRIKVKLADLGNSCFVHEHYSEAIQTMPYRSLEVIIRSRYYTSADIWSTACTAFELATGHCLFKLKPVEHISQEIDHIAQIIALLGSVPRHIARSGKKSMEFFDQRGEFKHKNNTPVPLFNLLKDTYHWNREDAATFTNFLLPMLNMDPKQRATAEECLRNRWLEPPVVIPEPSLPPLSRCNGPNPSTFSSLPATNQVINQATITTALVENELLSPASRGSTPIRNKTPTQAATCCSTPISYQVLTSPECSATSLRNQTLNNTTSRSTSLRKQAPTSTICSTTSARQHVQPLASSSFAPMSTQLDTLANSFSAALKTNSTLEPHAPE
ncbi:SRSF protein kinase 3-like isoform X2 [Lissotriton helveticus]